jgi:hypothetical protein
VISDIVSDDDNSTLDPLDTPMRLFDESAELATQRPPTLEASPLPVSARTPLGDDDASPEFEDTIPIVSQLGYTHSPSTRFDLPSKRVRITGEFSNATSESFHSVMLSHLNALVTQFESIGNAIPFSNHSTSDLDFAAMQSIIDKRNFSIDGVSIDGFFNCHNPLAFAAGTKNNPDILSQAQMLRATDRDLFVDCQKPEIEGLCDAGVFEFKNMSDLPSHARLLNAIWSYRRKRRPDGALHKYKSRICADGSQQSTALTIGKHMHQLFTGALFAWFLFSLPC